MAAMKLLGEPPEEVVVLGVQPMSTGWGAELTPPVQNALLALLDVVIAQLAAWAIEGSQNTVTQIASLWGRLETCGPIGNRPSG